MATSLRDYLDNRLPSLTVIYLRNFFSFLPWVTPVKAEVVMMRKLVNQAKSGSFGYLTYFINLREHFATLLEGIVNYSAEEMLILKTSEEQQQEEEKKDEEKESAAKIIELLPAKKVITSLPQMSDALKKDNWQEVVTSWFIAFQSERSEFIKFSKEFIQSVKLSSDNRTKECLVYWVETFSSDLTCIKNELFNGLQEGKDVQQYQLFIDIRSSNYIREVLGWFDVLGRMKAPEEPSQYGIQRDYHQLKYRLKDLRSSEPLLDISGVVEDVKRIFKDWKTRHPTSDKQIEDVRTKISLCLECLGAMIADYKQTPVLQQNYFKELQIQNQNRVLMQERDEFKRALRENTITHVSIQRLKELYPDANKDELRKIKLQCQRCAVIVFDAEDPMSKKQALQSHETEKYITSQSMTY